MTSFSIIKLTIKPIEDQVTHFSISKKFFLRLISRIFFKILQFISKEEDIIHHPDRAFYLLSRFHLLDHYLSKKNPNQVNIKVLYFILRVV